MILVFFTAWVSPFEFGFLDEPKGPLSIADNVVNGLFAIDIVLTFFVAYLDKATYLFVDSRKRIAWRYARTWLLLDVISTIPSELARKVLPRPLNTYGLYNMLRLWRLRRVSAMFARYEFTVPYLTVTLPSYFDMYIMLDYVMTYLTDWKRIKTSVTFGFGAPSLFV